MKTITMVSRRADMTRSAFKAYYEENHAPLGAKYIPFEKYVRNHIVSSVPQDFAFDVLLECWSDPRAVMEVFTTAVDRIFAEDEARFMDAPPRPEPIFTLEHLVKGAPRAVDPRGARKIAWLLTFEGPNPGESLKEAAAWGLRLADEVGAMRAIVDEVEQRSKSFVSGAILTLWTEPDSATPTIAPPPGIVIDAFLVLDSQETPPGELQMHFSGR